MNRSVLFAALVLPLCACRSHDRGEDVYDPQSRDMSNPSQSTTYQPPAANLTASERSFAETALRGGQFEVEASRLALAKASSGMVRDFANLMITEHGQANRELENLARKKGIYTSTMLDPEHQAKLEDLRRLDGPEFDRRYQQMQIEAHDQAIALFERTSRECRDADLRTFATRLLPVLQRHRDHLDDVAVATSRTGLGG